MLAPKLTCTALIALAFFATVAHADEICQDTYNYRNEGLKEYSAKNQFLIKDLCRNAYLKPAKALPAPAVTTNIGTEQAALTATDIITESDLQITGAAEAASTAMGTVHFRINSAKISNAGKKELMRIVAKLKGQQAPIVVEGFTCDLGDKKLNDHLALQRAKAVTRALAAQGVKVAKSEGKGKQGYVTKDKRKRQLNRRAEVIRLAFVSDEGVKGDK